MPTVTRRRSSRDEEPEEDRPTRRGRRSASEDESNDESPRRGRRSREEEEPEEDAEDKPRRRSRGDSDNKDEGRGRKRRGGQRGFGSYEERKSKTSSRADEFKPGPDKATLIKFLEEEPFDSYNQHWIEARDLPRDVKQNSYMCFDDEYFEKDDDYEEGCPLCGIGEGAKTYSLFNILNLSNPRKPVVQVWTAPPGVSEKLKRASEDKKTSPLNREDVYFEVELIKSKNKSEWVVQPVKARDLQEDFDMDPLDADEIENFAEKLFVDRADVTQVPDFKDLDDLAESIS